MEQYFVPIIVAVIGSNALFAFITHLIDRRDKKNDTVDSQTQYRISGLCELLWRELKNIYHEAKEHGGMTVEERNHLQAVYDSYHGLGGNGTGTRLYEDAMKLPVIE